MKSIMMFAAAVVCGLSVFVSGCEKKDAAAPAAPAVEAAKPAADAAKAAPAKADAAKPAAPAKADAAKPAK